MSDRLRLTLNSVPSALLTIADALSAFAKERKLPHLIESAIHLALEETVTNIIGHGYQGRADGKIDIEVALEPCEVVVTIEDAAPPYNPLAAPAPDFDSPLEQRKPGGLGVFLIKRLMDSLDYRYTGGKNRLTLRKWLPGKDGDGDHGTAL